MFWMRVTNNRPIVLIDNSVAIGILKAYHTRLGGIRMGWDSFLKRIRSIMENEIIHLVKPVKDKTIHHTHGLTNLGNILILRLHELHIPLGIGANLLLTTIQLDGFGPVEGNIKIGAPSEVGISNILRL